MTSKRRDVFQAIADPTRRQILQLVAQKPLHLNAVADQFNVSRPAISKHIRILSECGLLILKKQGRERHCVANMQQLKHVEEWISQYRVFWTSKLDALEKHLSPQKQQPKSTTKK